MLPNYFLASVFVVQIILRAAGGSYPFPSLMRCYDYVLPFNLTFETSFRTSDYVWNEVRKASNVRYFPLAEGKLDIWLTPFNNFNQSSC